MKRIAFADSLTWRGGAVAAPSFGLTRPVAARPRAGSRELGEIVSKAAIVTLFTLLAVRIAEDYLATGRVTGLLLLASEGLVIVFTIFRRAAADVDRSRRARMLMALSMIGPPLVRPSTLPALAPEVVTVIVSMVGLLVVVTGKLTLGRSFGLVAANRGVVSKGVYRLVRHPIYLGYLITHVAFVAANPSPWNIALLGLADTALLRRAMCEEQTLARDASYAAYLRRVHWRILPGVF